MSGDLDPEFRFETVPFQPDGGCPILSCLLLLFFGIPLAAATGVFSSIALEPILQVANYIPEWTLFFFAIAAAFMLINTPLMLFVYFTVRGGKMRNPAVVTILVMLISVVFIGSALLTEFVFWLLPGKVNLVIEMVVAYIAYGLAAAATVGIMITNGRRTASQPFCTVCQTWKKEHFQRQVNIPPHVLVRAVESGDIVPLADYDMRRPGPWKVTVTACPNCQLESPAEVKVDQETTDTRGQKKTVTLVHISYPGEAAVVLEEIFTPSKKKRKDQE